MGLNLSRGSLFDPGFMLTLKLHADFLFLKAGKLFPEILVSVQQRTSKASLTSNGMT
jgi:hypothetical protein